MLHMLKVDTKSVWNKLCVKTFAWSATDWISPAQFSPSASHFVGFDQNQISTV